MHVEWTVCAASELVANARTIADQLGATDRLFVRPDSPLKPFSGRVVDIATLTLAKLDHGFYYEDDSIPVVAAPIQQIGHEWRFLVVNRAVITGSAYDPHTRKPVIVPLDSTAAAFASTVASALPQPDIVYVLDICESNGQLRLLELNPFGGADLYACDADAIINSVSAIAAAA
ncbi:ATP-grasp domain-containing protein [Rosistilla carotiformis]|uniref:ATP-grasp domain-containing protein n=1 Tax=Rosistilla carotiformis TaxID=2528017 RepID=UPI003704CEB8